MIKNEIGINAGKIWQFLDTPNGKFSIKELKKLFKMTDYDFFLALGWLAHEGKALLFNVEGVDYVSLNY